MARILPLSTETISQIYSSKQITSLEDVVIGLVENSLDAGSNKIEITVEFRRGGCTVEDNGCGIPPCEFLEDGGLGKMYHTSKHATSMKDDVHGNTGTYLASLGALSLLSITTYHSNHDQQSTLTIHRRRVVARKVTAMPDHQLAANASQGTLVTVRDLFGNMPVRVKQRALIAGEGNDNAKEWLGLKRGIVALLLAWPKPCSIRIRDQDSENRMLHLSGVHPSVKNALTKKSLEQLSGRGTRFDLQDVLPILSQSGLAPMESRSQWIPVSVSTPGISIKGAICRDPAPTKQCQFISLGVHPCGVTSGNNDMYDVINKLFSNSSFGAIDQDLDIDEREKDRRKRDRRFKSDGYTQKQLHGRKGVDRWPMFVLKITQSSNGNKVVQPESMSESSLKEVLDVLQAIVTQWLTANRFRPRKTTHRKKEDSNSVESPDQDLLFDRRKIKTPNLRQNATSQSATTSKKRKYIDITGSTRIFEQHDLPHFNSPNDQFSSWSRIKSGRPSFYDDVWTGPKPATAPAAQDGTKLSVSDESSRPTLQLPTLAAGELSKIKPFKRDKPVEHPESGVFRTISPSSAADGDISSEEFGSFDDVEALAAVGDVEQLAILDVQPNSVSATVSKPSLEVIDDAVMDWTDPVTKKSFQINSRTGVVLPARPKSGIWRVDGGADTPITSRQVAAIDTSKSSNGNPLSLSRRLASSHSVQSNWLPGFLKDWNNPVFVQQTEERIPTTSFNEDDFCAAGAGKGKCGHAFQMDAFTRPEDNVASSLTKDCLRSAKVIQQVDHKYILCKASTSGEASDDGLLILIDQHAASERVILESLLAELCSPTTITADPLTVKRKSVRLEKAIHFQISETDYQMFHNQVQHFAKWGIIYQLFDGDEALGASQVRAPKRESMIVVKELPPAIAERCSLIPRLLIELLRSEIWHLDGTSKKPTHAPSDLDIEAHDEDHAWLKQLGSCPKGLLDLLNSRACRSAIMFNDILSIGECQQLLEDLSNCAFPFMCAHGRVSMVPLVKVGEELGEAIGGVLAGEDLNTEESFIGAFDNWVARDRKGSGTMIPRP